MFSIGIVIGILIGVLGFFLILQPQNLSNRSLYPILSECRSSRHKWSRAQMVGFNFCYRCHKLTTSWLSQLLQCRICGIVIHKLCKFIQLHQPSCKYLVSHQNTLIGYHQWRQSYYNITHSCCICHTPCFGIQSYVCIWCHRAKHGQCQSSLECDYGQYRRFIIEPSEINCDVKFTRSAFRSLKNSMRRIKDRTSGSEDDEQDEHLTFKLRDPSKTPIIALINRKVDSQLGNSILKAFYYYLNPLQVISILDEGLEKLKLYTQLKRLIIVVGGGDATVCSVLNYIKTIEEWKRVNPAVAIIPLGNRNDLSRCFGWGGRINEFNMEESIVGYEKGEQQLLDRWDMLISIGDENKRMTVYNYIGISIDKKMREYLDIIKDNEISYCQFIHKNNYNKINNQCKLLDNFIQLLVDGNHIEIYNIHTIILLNINYWGSQFTQQWKIIQQFKLYSSNDGLIQVAGLIIGNDEKPTEICQIAQGSKIQITCKVNNRLMFLHVDGQAVEIISPLNIVVQRKDQVTMLTAANEPRCHILHLLNQAFKKGIINGQQVGQIMALSTQTEVIGL